MVIPHGEFDRLAEVDWLPVVELGPQRQPRIDAERGQQLLDRLPVDRVVDVAVQVDVRRAQWPRRRPASAGGSGSSSFVEARRPSAAAA